MMTDPIADLLSRIRNAGMAQHTVTTCPASKFKLGIVTVLKDAGFLSDVRAEPHVGHSRPVLGLRYQDHGPALLGGIRRVGRPGRRVQPAPAGPARVIGFVVGLAARPSPNHRARPGREDVQAVPGDAVR